LQSLETKSEKIPVAEHVRDDSTGGAIAARNCHLPADAGRDPWAAA